MKEINNTDAEKMLLTGKSIDELIQIKIQEDFMFIKEQKKPKIEKITDLSKLKKDVIFSKNSVFKVFNKSSRVESYINGLQAEALLGLQNGVIESLIVGKIKAFVAEDAYVEFVYAKASV